MKNSKLGFGVFLVVIGIILIMINVGVVNWSIWNAMFTLWPLLLVVIGVNLMFRNNQIVRLVTWIVFIAILVAYGYYNQSSSRHPFNDMRPPFVRTFNATDSAFIEKADETKKAVLNLDVGAMSFDIGATNTGLVDAKIDNNSMSYDVNYSNGKETAEVFFKNNKQQFVIGRKVANDATFLLNENVKWDMDIDMGAVKSVFDLSELDVNKLNIDCGAASLDLKLGKRSQYLNVELNSGVSSINIEFPKDAGIKFKSEGALNNIDVSGIKFIKDGKTYTSENYNSASSKIDINASMGLGEIDIKGY